MSTLSPQRYLNRIYTQLPNDLTFISSLKLSQIFDILQKNLPLCPQCKLRQKNHYCMQVDCNRKTLLCINCDIKSLGGKHYLHDFTYLVPLFSQNVFGNFYSLKQSFQSFHECVSSQINKIYQYLQKLYRIQDISARQLQQLQCHEIAGRYKQFDNQLRELIRDFRCKQDKDKYKETEFQFSISQIEMKQRLESTFSNVNFISQQECLSKQQSMRQQLLNQINKLNWLQNPQKTLSQLLKQNQQKLSFSPPINQPQHSDIFISSRKKITITQIDSFFRNYNQLFTQNLQHHKVEVKIQPQLLNKPKFYEAFIYHFRDCERLSIDNAIMSHIRTPLSFRKLKQLEFNCNVETDTLCNGRIQNQNDQLQSFTIRKFRQEDIKVLKFITGPCKKLKSLHVEFFNKSDLSHNKDLVEYLEKEMQKDLSQFVIKMRTETQVKRLYGYLSKFSRETPDVSLNLSKTIVELLKSNPNLTTVIIDGVKGLDSVEVLNTLFEMKFLLEYKITYEGVNLMAEVDNEVSKMLVVKVQKRRRMLAVLAKMTKEKYYPQQILHTIGEEFLSG